MDMELRELSVRDGLDVLQMLREIGPGENGFTNTDHNMGEDEFPLYLLRNVQMAMGIGLKPGWVPQTIYWLYVGDKPVGIGKLRHYLTEHLMKIGGHIGYCIRPTNTPSRRVIERNGGRLANLTDGECHYWINLREGQ